MSITITTFPSKEKILQHLNDSPENNEIQSFLEKRDSGSKKENAEQATQLIYRRLAIDFENFEIPKGKKQKVWSIDIPRKVSDIIKEAPGDIYTEILPRLSQMIKTVPLQEKKQSQ